MLVRVETELSFAWARKNPDLFVIAILDFFSKYRAPDWATSVDGSRQGFVTLIARRVAPPTSLTGDPAW